MTRLDQFSKGNLRPGLFRLSERVTQDTLKRLCDRLGYSVFFIDGKAIRSKADFLTAFAKSLQFPDYFGHNWDALDDSITDLSWLGELGGLVIVWRGFGRFA